jgi:hypothetical protein
MHEIIIDEVTSTGKINLNGSLIIQEIQAVKELFCNLIDQTNHITVNHENANSFDLSYLQLLVALHKSAIYRNKEVEVEDKHPESFMQLIKESGCPFYKWLNIVSEETIEKGEQNG